MPDEPEMRDGKDGRGTGGGIEEMVFAGMTRRSEQTGAVLELGFEGVEPIEKKAADDPREAAIFAEGVMKTAAGAAAGAEANVADKNCAEAIVFGDDVEMPEVTILREAGNTAERRFRPIDGVAARASHKN